MSKSPKHKPIDNIYPIKTDVLIAFISQNGFLTTEFDNEIKEATLSNGVSDIRIFLSDMISREQVLQILTEATLSISDFEDYVENIRISDTFNMLIDASLISKTFKKGGTA